MKGVLSFHPIDPEFFDATIEPLVMGEKIDPEPFVTAATRMLVSSWETARYRSALEWLLEQLEPPAPPEDGTMWEKVRTRLERFDHKPNRLVRLVAAKVEPDLHLSGRPYLITEGSAESVASMAAEFMQAETAGAAQSLIIEQLVRLDPEIAKGVVPEELGEAPAPASYRTELLNDLKIIYDMARAAREGQPWGPADGRRETARDVLARELPRRAIDLHSRAVPFWVAEDVDGLDSICRAAGVEPPGFLVPAGRLFMRSCSEYPGIVERLGVDVGRDRSIGAFVAPQDIPQLLAFLQEHGARIIQAGARHNVGATCKTLLRKIRECASFADKAGVGYLEAAGVRHLHPVVEDAAFV